MDISIIVPCWNVQDYIKNLLLSFHMLDLRNISYEIIFVVEDNTTDNTVDVINQYMEDMEYTIIYSDGRTAGLARNKGVDFAHGDYIWFVDADDWIINPDILTLSIKYLRNNKVNDDIIQMEFVSNYFTKKHYSMVWQYIFKTDFIRNIPFSDKKYYEDNEFIRKVFDQLKSSDFGLIKIPSYFYNYNRPGSNTSLIREQLKQEK